MIRFIIKGLLRDRHRSLLPVLVIALGVMLTTFMYGYIMGMVGDMISTSAKLESGHVKIMTKDYAEIAKQLPNDFAIQNISTVKASLEQEFDVEWVSRTRFGGLLDIPDEEGETRTQGPVMGIGIDMLSQQTGELERFDLNNVLIDGRLPKAPGELLVSVDLSKNLGVKLGETATIIGGTANGSMAIHNFTVVGVFRYGIPALDRNMVFADISDVQYALDMENATGELLGFFKIGYFDEAIANSVKGQFLQQERLDGEGNPLELFSMTDQEGVGFYYALLDIYVVAIMAAMILVMSIVLWNAGLMSGLRRYGEIGVRLAMGESKAEIVRWLIYEALVIGIIGSTIGTLLGMSFNLYLQEVGVDISNMMQGSSLMMQPILRADVRPEGFIIGFIPGILAVVIGTSLAGIGVYKRSTASLFKELEV
jgi:putative ABC transport system permease protein